MACCEWQCPKCGSHMVNWYGTAECAWCDIAARAQEDDTCTFCGHPEGRHSHGGCEVPQDDSYCGCAGFNWDARRAR